MALNFDQIFRLQNSWIDADSEAEQKFKVCAERVSEIIQQNPNDALKLLIINAIQVGGGTDGGTDGGTLDVGETLSEEETLDRVDATTTSDTPTTTSDTSTTTSISSERETKERSGGRRTKRKKRKKQNKSKGGRKTRRKKRKRTRKN